MVANKSKIKQCFSKSRNSYDDNAHAQKLIVQKLMELLQGHLPAKRLKVLEIGCGTGLLTQELKSIPSIEELFINDLVEDICIQTASVHDIPPQCIIPGDIENIEIPYGFDVIVSSSTFQWFATPKDTLARLTTYLSPGGILIFNAFGKDNLKEIRAITGSGLHYPDKDEWERGLSTCLELIHSEEEKYTFYFSDPVDVLKHLKRTGVNAIESSRQWTPGVLQAFIHNYKNYAVQNQYPLTYHPIYIAGKK